MSTPPPESDPEPMAASTKPLRSFLRAFVATNYLLGKRRAALSTGIQLDDPEARRALDEITAPLSHGVQEHRARALAAEVSRLLRALGSQKLK